MGRGAVANRVEDNAAGPLLPPGEIEHGAGAARIAVPPLAIDPVGEGLRHDSLLAVPLATPVSQCSDKSTRVIYYVRKRLILLIYVCKILRIFNKSTEAGHLHASPGVLGGEARRVRARGLLQR